MCAVLVEAVPLVSALLSCVLCILCAAVFHSFICVAGWHSVQQCGDCGPQCKQVHSEDQPFDRHGVSDFCPFLFGTAKHFMHTAGCLSPCITDPARRSYDTVLFLSFAAMILSGSAAVLAVFYSTSCGQNRYARRFGT